MFAGLLQQCGQWCGARWERDHSNLISVETSLDEGRGQGWKTPSEVVAVSGKRDGQQYTLPLAVPSAPPYNRAVAEFEPGNRSAILSRDTSADVERLQVEAWRRMSPLEKAGIMSQATSDALTLARSGIRHRHPAASARECFIRLAALQLGPTLVRQVYPDASQILGPHV